MVGERGQHGGHERSGGDGNQSRDYGAAQALEHRTSCVGQPAARSRIEESCPRTRSRVGRRQREEQRAAFAIRLARCVVARSLRDLHPAAGW